MHTKLVNLTELDSVVATENDDFMQSYLRMHDFGFKLATNQFNMHLDELKILNTAINQLNLSNIDTDGFLIGYISSNGGIREEFDLLRFGENNIFNLELKASLPKNGESAILRQLRRHKKYLSVTNPSNVYVCTYLFDNNIFFGLDDSEQLIELSPEKVTEYLDCTNSADYTPKEIDLSSMIVSPYVNTKEFSSHNYFLTNSQYKTRDNILNDTNKNIILTGEAGSGKTLVLFDLAKKFTEANKKVQVYICAPLNNHSEMSDLLGFNIFPISLFKEHFKPDVDVLIIDEAQKIYQSYLDIILNISNVTKIYSIDKKQILHPNQDKLTFHTNVISDPTYSIYKLKGHIRYDPELGSFIKQFISNKPDSKLYDYNKVNLIYANNSEDAEKIIIDKVNKHNYVSIEPTPYTTKTTNVLRRKKICYHSISTHSVVGREYDNVLVVLDQYYKRTENGLISTYPAFYPHKHIALIFEALTRVKQNLIILIVNNPDLFISTQRILTTKDSFEYKFIQNTKEDEKDFIQISSYISKDESTKKNFSIMRDYILDICIRPSSIIV